MLLLSQLLGHAPIPPPLHRKHPHRKHIRILKRQPAWLPQESPPQPNLAHFFLKMLTQVMLLYPWLIRSNMICSANSICYTSSHNLSLQAILLKGNVIRLVCNVLLCQRQGDNLILCHWYTFSPVRQKIRCSPSPFLQQCPGSFIFISSELPKGGFFTSVLPLFISVLSTDSLVTLSSMPGPNGCPGCQLGLAAFCKITSASFMLSMWVHTVSRRSLVRRF